MYCYRIEQNGSVPEGTKALVAIMDHCSKERRLSGVAFQRFFNHKHWANNSHWAANMGSNLYLQKLTLSIRSQCPCWRERTKRESTHSKRPACCTRPSSITRRQRSPRRPSIRPSSSEIHENSMCKLWLYYSSAKQSYGTHGFVLFKFLVKVNLNISIIQC